MSAPEVSVAPARPRTARLRIRSARLAPLLLLCLSACGGGPPDFAELAPAGSTPDQVRFFCTQESDRAAAFVGFPPDFVAQRLRAANAAFAACMARNNVQP
jgi:hypothetical protein